ncbi:Pyruvate/2-oxoglutarate dehydrogenase complex [Pseudomonas syringae pv. actinidiae]|uniref:Pyruvate/2-oxoglutarate dehydrogenase complex n=1 Tax=Pseudomonas syringae pv. actinidiae TaxID=103796 RepID=A0A2V0R836_PSESF|nr:Pyruvate/2-oxoglutarate dehydrogenase complex [Pseudomonas syringae pv. actinidiae]GBH21341.1 Pyruvate/2-oxoglutarate dehydrogenase complex [Pseudomonas syringae pv. actinidiae]
MLNIAWQMQPSTTRHAIALISQAHPTRSQALCQAAMGVIGQP